MGSGCLLYTSTEYSVRTAMEAVFPLLNVDRGVPDVFDSFYDVMEVEAGFLKYCMELLAREYSEDLKRLEAELPRVDRIPCVRFDEAKRLAAEKYGCLLYTSYWSLP